MRKFTVLALCLAVTISLAGCAKEPGNGQEALEGSGKKVRIMIGYENNPGEPIDLACQEWKRLVEI